MFSLLGIPIVAETANSSSSLVNLGFFSRPLDIVLFDILVWFGWIPIAITFIWGFIQIWVNYQQGKTAGKLKHILLAIDVPSMTEQTPKALENLFATIYGCKSSLTWKEKWILGRFHPTFSFEMISSEGYIQFLIRCQTRFRDILEAGIYAHYPDAEISEVEDYTTKFPKEFPNNTYEMWGSEMTLDGPSYHPIRTYVDFEDSMTQEIKDPLGFTLEQMAKMRPGEHFWIQYLVQPSSNDWIKDGVKRINEIYGIPEKSKKGFIESALTPILDIPSGLIEHATNFSILGTLFGAHAKAEEDPFKAFKLSVRDIEEAKAIFRKTSKVGLGTKIRILYIAKKEVYAKVERTGIVKGILNQFSHLQFNKFTLFIPQVPKDDYFWMRWSYTKKQKTLMGAYCRRSFAVGAQPKFLNAEELATLWHFPTISIKAPLIKKSESKRAEPPFGLPFTFEDNALASFATQEQEVSHTPLLTMDVPKAEVPASEPPMPPAEFLPTLTSPTQQDETFVPPNLPT